jgi:N utilization substance protein A
VLVDLGKVEALLPRSEQVDGERYEQGSRIKAVITEVRSGTKGPQVIVSRRDPELIKTLFELEVPEIADGLVEIRGVAREPGYRSKIAVESHAQGVDPVGACVGPRGSRVRMVVSELRGEKIDIIPWNPEPARFVAKALSPARVREVYLDDDGKEATVVTPDDQLALAIGKEGMNARLAARLTGWKIDIQSDSEFAQAEAEAAFGGGGEDEEFTGRCAAILSNGKRCPNAALPGSRYCGVAAHQELAERETESPDVEPIVTESEPELEALADELPPDAEAVGPAVPEPGDEPLESEAPADVAATHGPPATAVADAEGEVDLDVTDPRWRRPRRFRPGFRSRPRAATTQRRRRVPALREHDHKNVRRLRAEGAEGRPDPLRRPRGRAVTRPEAAGTGRLHLSPAGLLRARGGAIRLQPSPSTDRARRSGAGPALH